MSLFLIGSWLEGTPKLEDERSDSEYDSKIQDKINSVGIQEKGDGRLESGIGINGPVSCIIINL